jgi:hypothetical protein
MRKKRDSTFADASGMRPGDVITYDPTKEGTGDEEKEGIIKEISRSFFSLVLEDGTAIGVTRVYTHRCPDTVLTPPPPTALPAERRERRLPPSQREEKPAEPYISFPF